MYLRDELIFDFDKDGIVNAPMSFEIVEVVELLLILQLYKQKCWVPLWWIPLIIGPNANMYQTINTHG